MNPLYHKLVFALAVLDDDKDSLLILCDVLEQNGEMALAQWGRAKKRNWQKRMDFVLGVVPHNITLYLTCDFLAESLQRLDQLKLRRRFYDQDRRNMTSLITSINDLGSWSWTEFVSSVQPSGEKNSIDPSNALQSISEVFPWAYGVQGIDLIAQTLHAAGSGIASAGRSTRPHEIDAAKSACRKVAKASREIVRPYATDIVSQQQPIGNMAAHAEKIQQLKDEIRENQFAAIENTVNRAIQLIS